MDIININKEKTIYGLTTRTTNKAEMNPAESKIGVLARHFDEQVVVDYRGGARVYSVYYEYESDVNGAFTVLIGADRVESAREELTTVVIPAGKYLVFEGKGTVPQMVIDTWKKVWAYFSDINNKHRRAYTTDFEFYKNANEIEIYIAIK